MRPRCCRQETRLTLSNTPDPQDAAKPAADETPDPEAEERARLESEEAPPDADAPPSSDAGEEPGEPGVGEAIGGARAAFVRMLDAHVALLRAELEITGRELGIIAGLAMAALAIAILVGILLYVGTFLFLGDWLFGSMGWGIIHGTLIGAVVIAFVAINLGGGDVSRYGWGGVIGVTVAVVLALLLLSNVGNEAAEWGSRLIREQIPESDLPFGGEWVVTLVGIVVGAVIGGIVALIASWSSQFSRPFAAIMTGLAVGGFVGAIYASTRYDAVDGVFGLVIMIGLLTWIIVGLVLAARAGFDPEARYADLVPRETIESFKKTKAYGEAEFQRLKGRFLGR